MDARWEEALRKLDERLGRQQFETWIKPLQMRGQQLNEIQIEVPNKFFRDWLTEHFLTHIQEILSEVCQQSVIVVFSINQQLQITSPTPKRAERDAPPLNRPACQGPRGLS